MVGHAIHRLRKTLNIKHCRDVAIYASQNEYMVRRIDNFHYYCSKNDEPFSRTYMYNFLSKTQHGELSTFP